jgi:hypothetical protein
LQLGPFAMISLRQRFFNLGEFGAQLCELGLKGFGCARFVFDRPNFHDLDLPAKVGARGDELISQRGLGLLFPPHGRWQ